MTVTPPKGTAKATSELTLFDFPARRTFTVHTTRAYWGICGYCGGPRTGAGGFATRHADGSIYGAYCAPCIRRYGYPNRDRVDYRVMTP